MRNRILKPLRVLIPRVLYTNIDFKPLAPLPLPREAHGQSEIPRIEPFLKGTIVILHQHTIKPQVIHLPFELLHHNLELSIAYGSCRCFERRWEVKRGRLKCDHRGNTAVKEVLEAKYSTAFLYFICRIDRIAPY